MMKSLYSGVAGMKTHTQRMDVIGNNISNVNTTAYKASTVTFKDVFYQNKSRASTGTYSSGGTNANQVGYGAQLNSIAQLMTQSGLTYSDRVTDCAIQGEGFFQVMDSAGNIYYTRNGSFHIDNYGNLCDASGNIVLGVSGDPTGVAASSQRINLYVPSIENTYASATKTVNITGGSYTFSFTSPIYGEDGDISITIQDGDFPFATQNGSNIIVTIDLDQDFGLRDDGTYSAEQAAADFQQAIWDAMNQGGITLVNDAQYILFDFIDPPGNNDINALNASNELTYEGDYTDADGNSYSADIDLTFTAVTAGDYANSFEIDIQTSANATDVNARWSDNVLIITVPAGDNGTYPIDRQTLQDAIDAAAGGNANKMITVNGQLTEQDVRTLNGLGVTLRVGLKDGRDNIMKSLAEVIGTVKLTDGHTAATQTTEDLEEIYIDEDGVIYGVHAVHGTIALGRIDLAIFENPEGLNQVGTTYWQVSLSSGDPKITKANEIGVGSVVYGALEMSNVDLSQEISDMIITQRGFQANSRVITVTDTMLEELVNLKR